MTLNYSATQSAKIATSWEVVVADDGKKIGSETVFCSELDNTESAAIEAYLAARAPIEVTLDMLKTQKRLEIERARDAGRFNQGALVTTPDGYTWQADPSSLKELNDALTLFMAVGSTPPGYEWRDVNNVNHPADLALLASIAAARATQVNAIWQQSWSLKAQVDAAATQADLDAIVVPAMLTGNA